MVSNCLFIEEMKRKIQLLTFSNSFQIFVSKNSSKGKSKNRNLGGSDKSKGRSKSRNKTFKCFIVRKMVIRSRIIINRRKI